MVLFNQKDATLANIARVVEKRLADPKVTLTLVLDPAIGELESKFEDGVITGGSYADILFVAGKYLRNPKLENGSFRSYKELCGLYWATHNQGYSECAPMEELYEDIENQALWGMNTIKVWFDMAQHKIEESGEFIDRLLKILKYAKSLGLKTAMGGTANEAFDDSPVELRADWTPGHDGYVSRLNAHYQREICPSKPGGLEKIEEYRRAVLEAFQEVQLDYYDIGPYDQGGCTCTACAPWGGNGYIRCVKRLIPVLKAYQPSVRPYLNTWYFGMFRAPGDVSEFDLLAEEIAKGELEDVAYISCEPQVHRYPFEKPLGKPYIGFPEISMCSIFPWGGYGAIAVPNKIQKNWDQNERQLRGGFPYCEGFYEDLNKAIVLRLYRENQPAAETVREYLSYEFGLEGDMLEQVHGAVMAMEQTHMRVWEPGHRYVIVQPEKVFEIEDAILAADTVLPEKIRCGKKWKLFYYRARIDAELARNDFYRNDKVMQYFEEMIKLYHLENANWYLKPDVVTDEKYGRPLTRDEIKIIAMGGELE